MFAALTGSGLAIAAGLNAFIPILMVGILARFTDLLVLPAGWQWLSNGWVLILLAGLLVVDVLADKIPAIDHINDILQTAIRPTSGGIVFTAGIGSTTTTVTDPGTFVGTRAFGMFVVGLLLALAVHVVKAVIRALVNVTTAGIAAPIISSAEEAASVALAMSAVVFPVLVIVLVGAGIALAVWRWKRWRGARGAVPSAGPAGRGQRRLPGQDPGQGLHDPRRGGS